MKNVFYEIMSIKDDEYESPVYLWVINGAHMLQSGIYDATKFTTKDLAKKKGYQ